MRQLAAWLIVGLLFLGNGPSWAASSASPLILISQIVPDIPIVEFDAIEQEWLDSHDSISIGLSKPDAPPFEIIRDYRYFEGIIADYIETFQQNTGLTAKVMVYPSREQLFRALESGEIDLIARGTAYEAERHDLLTGPLYSTGYPVMVTLKESTLDSSGNMAGLRIAIMADYISEQQIRSSYPDSMIQTFDDVFDALEALTNRKADVFIADNLFAHYLIIKNPSLGQRLVLRNFAPFEGLGFRSLLSPDNRTLNSIINKIGQKIRRHQKRNILRRWTEERMLELADSKLVLTARERQWLSRPIRTLGMESSHSPNQFDSNGVLYGASSDLLNLIAEKTGLQFVVHKQDSLKPLVSALQNDRADLAIALPPTPELQQKLRFSQPFLSGTPVLVTRNDQRLLEMNELNGKKLAILRGHPSADIIRKIHPGITLVETRDHLTSLHWVNTRKVDAYLTGLMKANTLLTRFYPDELQIAATLPRPPTYLDSFALARHNPELASILEKALLSINQSDIQRIIERQQPSVGAQRPWPFQFSPIWIGFILLLIGVLLAAWRIHQNHQQNDKKRLQNALNDQLVFRSTLINSIPNPIFVIDRDGHLLDGNEKLLKLTNTRHEGLHQKNLIELSWLQADDAQALFELLNTLIKEEKFYSAEHTLTLSKGDTIRIFLWITPFYDNHKVLQGLIGGWIDLTKHYQLLLRLESSLERVEIYNLAKKAFYSTIHHEVRTPMNSLIGLQELVLEKAKTGLIDVASLEVAQDSAKALLALIGDILDIADIEDSHLQLHPAPARLGQLIDSTFRLFIGQAQQKKLTLNLDLDESVDCWVLIDTLRFKQILFNLLNNAMRYTHRGHITLKGRAERVENQIRISIQITDTGVGISEQEQAFLFHPVIKRSNRRNKENGIGVGLLICRRLSELMGGKLSLKSIMGEGTQVDLSFQVPLSEPKPVSLKTDTTATEPLQILVVDDHPANRLVLKQQLMFLGHHPSLAEDGLSALKIWEPGKFDVILTDCQMPVMDGYELAREIRHREQEAGQPPCLLLGITANIHPDEARKCRESGMDGCQFKPLELDCLRSIFASLNERQSSLVVASSQNSALSFDIDAALGEGARYTEAGRMLIEQLVETNDSDARIILDALTANDYPLLGQMGHRIAGVASLIRAMPLEQLCHELERMCQRQTPPADIERHVEQVLAALRSLQQEMQNWLKPI